MTPEPATGPDVPLAAAQSDGNDRGVALLLAVAAIVAAIITLVAVTSSSDASSAWQSALRQEVARALRWPTLQHGATFHEHFFEAIKDGDAERAVAQMTAHYGRVAVLIRRYLREAEARSKGHAADRWLPRSGL